MAIYGRGRESADEYELFESLKRNDELPRVVGYFDTKKSLAFDEFYDAAIDFQPLIPFYAVFNWQLAKE